MKAPCDAPWVPGRERCFCFTASGQSVGRCIAPESRESGICPKEQKHLPGWRSLQHMLTSRPHHVNPDASVSWRLRLLLVGGKRSVGSAPSTPVSQKQGASPKAHRVLGEFARLQVHSRDFWSFRERNTVGLAEVETSSATDESVRRTMVLVLRPIWVDVKLR